MYMGDLSKDNIVWNKKRLLYSSVPNNRLPRWCSGEESACQCRRQRAPSLTRRKVRRAVKRWLNRLYGAVLLGLCLSLAGSLSPFPTGDLFQGAPERCLCISSPGWTPAQSCVGCLASSVVRWCHLLFELQGVFLCLCSFPWPLQKWSLFHSSRAQLLLLIVLDTEAELPLRG